MKLTYRTRQNLKKWGIFLGIFLGVFLVVWLGWLIYMGRFMVYSDEGARLDPDWQAEGEAVAAVPPDEETVNIVMNDGESLDFTSTELEKVSGYYATTTMLKNYLAETEEMIRDLPKGSTVMLDVKNGAGTYFYKTYQAGSTTANADLDGIRDLIEYLSKADYYLVARIPAFRDRAFALNNTKYGLSHVSGMYLWAGEDKCYWLDPTKTGTIDHLISVIQELKVMGFDEVVLTDFCFPDTTEIVFDGSRIDALNDAAQKIAESCVGTTFAVSFVCDQEGFVLPQGRTRLYRTNVDAVNAADVAASMGLEEPELHLVFLTEAMDTRFDRFGVLRPLPVGIADFPVEETLPPEPAETTQPPEPSETTHPPEAEPEAEPEA